MTPRSRSCNEEVDGAAAAIQPQEPLQIEPRDPGDGVDGAGLGSRGAAGWKLDEGSFWPEEQRARQIQAGQELHRVINTSYLRGARTKRPAKQADTEVSAAELNLVIILAVFVPQAARRYSLLN